MALVLAGCSGGHRKTITVAINGASATIAPNGTFSLTASVTNDKSGDGVTWSSSQTTPPLTNVTTTSATYTAPSSVPSNPSVTITATSIADTSVSQSVTFTIQGSVSTTACGPSPTRRGNEGALDGVSVAFLVKGADASDTPIAYAGSVTFDGDGSILNGTMDIVSFENESTGQQAIDFESSSFSYGSDGRGCLSLDFNPAPQRAKHPARATKAAFHGLHAGRPVTLPAKTARTRNKIAAADGDSGAVVFSFVLLDTSSGPGRIEEFDNTTGSGTVAAGQMAVQDSDAFGGIGGLANAYAFGADGWATAEGGGILRAAVAGNFANDGEGNLTNGTADENIQGSVNFGAGALGDPLQGGSGQLSSTVDDTTGRGTGNYQASDNEQDVNYDFAFYIINNNDAFVISTDDPNDTGYMISGRWLKAATSGNSVGLSGNYLNSIDGLDCNECSSTDPGNNYVSIAVLNVNGGVPSGNDFINDAGSFSNNQFHGNYSFNATFGRAAFSEGALSNEVAYVTVDASEDEIVAFTIGTDDNAGSGYLFTQPTATYNNASLTGNYAYGTAEDVTGITASEAGVFDFDGNGGYTGTADVIIAGAQYHPDQVASGTYSVNDDGSGTLNGGALALVTNGTLTVAIDETDTFNDQPLLYFFLQQPAGDARAKAKTKATTKANAKTTVKAAATATSGAASGFFAKPKSN